jgi:glycerol-3-phosphate dehydrogenase (NAD(P)+)
MKIAVIGAGTWGTTLSNLLANKGARVQLWVRRRELLSKMKTLRENPTYLPGVHLSESLEMSTDLREVLEAASAVFLVVPSQYLRQVLHKARSVFPPNPMVVCASKGIELESCKTMSQLVREELEDLRPQLAVLSGPSFAKEVSRGLPAAVHVGARSEALRREVQRLVSTPAFKAHPTRDAKGVELGGALKNIIALASGMSDGLELGSNARAAVMTQGLSEMARLGSAMGATAKTFMGLSGMGDLVLTCTGDLSRNRRVGFRLGTGERLEEVTGPMHEVAEGVKTAQAAYRLCPQGDAETPIMKEVYRVLFEGREPSKGLERMLG